MPAYVAQRLQSAALEPFARANNNNAAAWIQPTKSKLSQMECLQQFWIAEISIQPTHNTGTWCNKWHKKHTKKNWDTFCQNSRLNLPASFQASGFVTCNPHYPATQSQIRKSTQIAKSNNMNK
ncbi:hypothetical protein DSO57_1039211 [Entomophthora muscae]|nr:hypothetical protein DSO57_1039211 [Entomophthora muscae]